MIRVCIEVDRGTVSSTTLSVKAESIPRALEVVGEQNPGCDFVVEDSEGVETEIAA